ncbi:TetR/AcrR family transcriptional regulator [Thalassospira mesophila]|uniref:TetR/AcrR family transcriptional regulator n=1 Tax=Thalassospira mesophila TaxID=1293891 RepID=UPI000A1D6DB0|nr:TetR/AcrR family transcriptional regulator [Thalassospira mesophila]
MRADARKNYDHLLVIARDAVMAQGAEVSLREIARKAGVGLGTLYRHFPTREALFEALLRARFDELTIRARDLETADSSAQALVFWLREAVAVTQNYSGVIALMVAAIAEPDSALHTSCVAMRAAGTQLLVRAQAANMARADIDGTDLFGLVGALGWIGDQPVLVPRAEHLFDVIADAILTDQGRGNIRAQTSPPQPVENIVKPEA